MCRQRGKASEVDDAFVRGPVSEDPATRCDSSLWIQGIKGRETVREARMSAEDPSVELQEIMSECERGALPAAAGQWASSALETVTDILDTIDGMLADGKRAPTAGQSQALRNYHEAACRWLKRVPDA